MPANLTLAQAAEASTAHITVAQGGTLGACTIESNYNPAASPPRFSGSVSAVFSIQITIPSAVNPEGIIFETGSAVSHIYLGFDGNYDLIFKAWAGRFPTNSERVVYDGSLLPRDQTITITGEVRHFRLEANPAVSGVRLWVDHTFAGQGQLASGVANQGAWASVSVGGMVDGSTGGVLQGEAGNFTDPVSASGVVYDTGLRYWHDTLVGTLKLDRETVLVIQTDEADLRTLALDAETSKVWQLFSRQVRIDWTESEIYRQVVFDHNRIFDVTMLNSGNARIDWTDSEFPIRVVQDHNLVEMVKWTDAARYPVLQLDSRNARVR
jgi:hypothetical protein